MNTTLLSKYLGPLDLSHVDWLGIIHKFANTDTITSAELSQAASLESDNHFYELQTNEGTLFIYEVDYISGLEYEMANIKNVLGPNALLFRVKDTTKFEKTAPVLSAKKSTKPGDWENISKYVTDYSGSADYYYKFLIRSE